MGQMQALGFIETFGIVYVLEAADVMCKSASVELIGFENVASGYISVVIEGDVEAVQQAVESGIEAVKKMNGSVYSSNVIARPHPAIQTIIKRYELL